jgi:hypothetical protein
LDAVSGITWGRDGLVWGVWDGVWLVTLLVLWQQWLLLLVVLWLIMAILLGNTRLVGYETVTSCVLHCAVWLMSDFAHS